jgi:hypothetical protein
LPTICELSTSCVHHIYTGEELGSQGGIGSDVEYDYGHVDIVDIMFGNQPDSDDEAAAVQAGRDPLAFSKYHDIVCENLRRTLAAFGNPLVRCFSFH